MRLLNNISKYSSTYKTANFKKPLKLKNELSSTIPDLSLLTIGAPTLLGAGVGGMISRDLADEQDEDTKDRAFLGGALAGGLAGGVGGNLLMKRKIRRLADSFETDPFEIKLPDNINKAVNNINTKLSNTPDDIGANANRVISKGGEAADEVKALTNKVSSHPLLGGLDSKASPRDLETKARNIEITDNPSPNQTREIEISESFSTPKKKPEDDKPKTISID